MTRLMFFLLLTASFSASAVVVRHDVDDANYRVAESEFPALVDLPHEGHGVLISSQWIVTAAHATQGHPITEVMLNGTCRTVERVIIHPGYRNLPNELLSGDAAPAMEFQIANDDIALIKLAMPVTDVVAVALHGGNDELRKTAKLFGKGAAGSGTDGIGHHAQRRTTLRRTFNTITAAEGRWLSYSFDADSSALPLEGMTASGDSGGPVLLEVDGQWQLAGLTAWTYWEGDIAAYRAGLYGLSSYNVRLSNYAEWMEQVMAPDGAGVDESPLGESGG